MYVVLTQIWHHRGGMVWTVPSSLTLDEIDAPYPILLVCKRDVMGGPPHSPQNKYS
jgi:hypothetical protein